MKTPLDLFYDGCDVYGNNKYGSGYKTMRHSDSMNNMTTFAINYMLGKLNEKNTPKKITKANAKSKQENGKQVKSVLKAKKRVPAK